MIHRLTITLCVLALLALLGLAAGEAEAKDLYVAEMGQLHVTLTDAACTSDIARAILSVQGFDEKTLKTLKKAKVVAAGRALDACWLRFSDDRIMIADDDMDAGFILWKEFRPAGTPKGSQSL